jgi:sugar (pentulose or hexulose) kinase
VAELLLGIDAGTTALKAAVYAPDGRCLGAGGAPQGVRHPQPGWVEQDPAVWWRGLVRAVRQAIAAAGASGEDVAALGLSTQGGTIAVFDAEGRPRGPALVWSDARQSGWEGDEAARAEHFRLTGVPHLHMTPAALRWLQANRREWFADAYRIGYVPDFLTFRLTGEWVSDPTNLAISNLCELAAADIAQAELSRAGVPREAFAVTRRAGEAAGALRPRAARVLGLRPGIPVAAPAHDQYAAALGAGCTQAGDLLLSAGTAWVVLLATERPVTDARSSFWPAPHVQPGLWGLLGAISSGGSTLDHVRALTGGRGWGEVTEAAGRVRAGSEGLLVIPHLVGRTLPSSDPEARGALLGWSLGHMRAHLWRAAMEGVALETRVACEYLSHSLCCPSLGNTASGAQACLNGPPVQATHHPDASTSGAARGAAVSGLRMVGGGARSALWPSIVASVLDVPVRTAAAADMAVRGAACLAARCLGRPDLPQVQTWQEHEPVAAWRAPYDRAYARYRNAVACLEKGDAEAR